MTPEQIAEANTELAHQSAYFCWINQTGFAIHPGLKFAFAIPNGGERNIAVAARMKQSGTKKGVPDVFLPIPAKVNGHIRIGLWIEFKRPKSKGKSKGELSEDQEKWRDYLVSQNYSWFLAETYLQAIDATLNYLHS